MTARHYRNDLLNKAKHSHGRLRLYTPRQDPKPLPPCRLEKQYSSKETLSILISVDQLFINVDFMCCLLCSLPINLYKVYGEYHRSILTVYQQDPRSRSSLLFNWPCSRVRTARLHLPEVFQGEKSMDPGSCLSFFKGWPWVAAKACLSLGCTLFLILNFGLHILIKSSTNVIKFKSINKAPWQISSFLPTYYYLLFSSCVWRNRDWLCWGWNELPQLWGIQTLLYYFKVTVSNSPILIYHRMFILYSWVFIMKGKNIKIP